MTENRPLFIPVILGTPRQGRMSEHVANVVFTEVAKRPGVESMLIDVRSIGLTSENEGEDIKDSGFSAQCDRADAFVIVAPEYNHGYPGILKHVLDTNLKEYIHKAVGIVGVSAGPFGGTRGTGNGHREAGQAAIDTFTEWKSVYVDFSGRLQRAQIDTDTILSEL